MKGIKRWAAGLLILCLTLCALAEVRADALGKMIPGLLEEGNAFTATVSGTMETYPPYGEKRLEQLNRLLGHLSLRLEKAGEQARVELLVDGKRAVSITRKAGEMEEDAWFEEETKAEPGKNRSLLWMLEEGEAFLDQLYAMLSGLVDRFPERYREGKESLTYREYGAIVKKKTGVIPPEDAEALLEYLAGAGEPLASILTKTPTLSGQQRSNLFLGEEGQILRLTYDGTIGRDADSLRKVSLNWRRLRTETKELDNLTLKTPAASGGDRNNLVMERRYEEREDGTRTLGWTLSFDDVADRVRTSTEISIQLENQAGRITGELVRKEKTGNQLTRWYVKPEITRENETDSEGRLEIVRYSGKIEMERGTVSLRLRAGETENLQSGEADGESGDGKGMKEERTERMAAELLRVLLSLPEEDLLFLTDGLSETDLAAITRIIEP